MRRTMFDLDEELEEEELVEEPEEEVAAARSHDAKKIKAYLDAVCKTYHFARKTASPFADLFQTHIVTHDGATVCDHKMNARWSTYKATKIPKDICKTCLHRLGYFGQPAPDQWRTLQGKKVKAADLYQDCDCRDHDGPHTLYMIRKAWGSEPYRMDQELNRFLQRFRLVGMTIVDFLPSLVVEVPVQFEQMTLAL